jgi:hypothetical protein
MHGQDIRPSTGWDSTVRRRLKRRLELEVGDGGEQRGPDGVGCHLRGMHGLNPRARLRVGIVGHRDAPQSGHQGKEAQVALVMQGIIEVARERGQVREAHATGMDETFVRVAQVPSHNREGGRGRLRGLPLSLWNTVLETEAQQVDEHARRMAKRCCAGRW